jgi:hypothetical protein
MSSLCINNIKLIYILYKKYFSLKTFKLDNVKEILLFVVENVMRFQLFFKSLFFDTR